MGSVSAESFDAIPGSHGRNECDTNADTCCLGQNWRILEYTCRTADVYSYDHTQAPITGVPIVTAATSWNDPTTGETLVLVINEGLYYGRKLDHSLINPNQLRCYGIHCWDNPFDSEKGLKIQVDDIQIPMQAQGTKISFESTAPTDEELENCLHVELSSKQEWNPGTVQLGALDSDIPNSNKPRIDLLDVPVRDTYTSTERHLNLSTDLVAQRFGIGRERARETLNATIQRGTRSAILPIGRRYRADRRFGVRRLLGKFATDTFYSKTRSLRGNIAAQLFGHKCGLSAVYPIPKADNTHVAQSLSSFITDFGVPENLTYDGAAVQVGRHTTFQNIIRTNDIKAHVSAPRRPNENPAEGFIREVKRKWYRIQDKVNAPDRLWDFGVEYVCEIGNITSNLSRYSKGRTPLEIITGETPDISEYLDFAFYDWVYYRTNAGLGPVEIGRWLGVSHRVGQLMSYWILPSSGIPISCTTVQRVPAIDMQTDEWKERVEVFNNKVNQSWNVKSANITNLDHVPKDKLLSLEDEDEEFLKGFRKVISDPDLPEADEEYGAVDPYIGMELGMPVGGDGERIYGQVKRRAVDENGRPIGRPSNNPMMDSRQYEIEFVDGKTDVVAANIIAENLLAQIDEEGRRKALIQDIEDHRSLPSAILKDQGTYFTPTGNERMKRTTRGWELYVRWKDGDSNWVSLKDLKDSYPIELAEYAVSNNLQHEPAFAWWVPYTLRKKKAILQKVKSKYWEKTHKYGIRVPKNVREAREIDAENKNTLWQDAISLEMKNNRVAFETYEGRIEDLIGYEQITGHLIFDVKLSENFRRKARFVADGHLVETPASVTYSTVVSRDSIRILLTAAALNEVDVMGADIQNAFLSAPNKEKNWIKAGPEFGPEQGKVFIVVRALYGLKSACAAFRAFMARKLDKIGFSSCVADPDVWLRPGKKANGDDYYEYIVMYVDDILAISEKPEAVLKSLEGNTVKYKNGKIGPPEVYLGAKLSKKSINGVSCWTITSVDYIKAAVKTIKDAVGKKKGWVFPTRIRTPMLSSFIPELDDSEELDPGDLQFFQEMIGMLRWATELGRVDILIEVSLLSQYQASARKGHMIEALRIFAFLEKNPKLSLYMDPQPPNLDYSLFSDDVEEFKEYYRDAKEEMPHRMPKSRGVPVVTTAFVDSSHGANRVTRKSHSGHILFVNRAPVKWYSKRQPTVETSAFSSEFLAMKHCIEDIEYLRFKLRMFGIPLSEDKNPTYVLCDNEGVVKNSSLVESSLNKKHSAIAYNFARWNVAAGVCRVAWIPTGENIADALTKRLSKEKRDYLFGNWTY